MKIDGRITFLVHAEYTTIEIRDDKSNIRFVEAKLTPEQLSSILSRRGDVKCDVSVYGLDLVGKQHKNQTFEFEIPEHLIQSDFVNRSEYSKKLTKYAQELLDKENEGWIADDYFGGQDSFFTHKEKRYARCTIRRWT